MNKTSIESNSYADTYWDLRYLTYITHVSLTKNVTKMSQKPKRQIW